MPRTPTIAQLYRQLTDIVKRMDAVEKTLGDFGHDITVLNRWHEDTDFAKQILKEYEEQHPEAVAKQDTINTRAWVAVLAALAALTTIILAKFS